MSAHLRASTERGTKNSSCVELECGTTPLVRGDSARSHFTLTLASEECSEVPRSTWQGRKTNRCSSNGCLIEHSEVPRSTLQGRKSNRFPRPMVGVLSQSNLLQAQFLCCAPTLWKELPQGPQGTTALSTPPFVRAEYDCRNNNTSLRRPEAVGWAPSVLAGPLTTSLRGLWVSGLLPPGNGGTNEGAATLKPTK